MIVKRYESAGLSDKSVENNQETTDGIYSSLFME